MCAEELAVWSAVGVVREGQAVAGEGAELLVARTVGGVADEDVILVVYGRPAAVERPVVETAQREAVSHVVDAVLAFVVDVYGLDLRPVVRRLAVPATDRTGLAVRLPDRLGERPATDPPFVVGELLCLRRRQFRPESLGQPVVLRADLFEEGRPTPEVRDHLIDQLLEDGTCLCGADVSEGDRREHLEHVRDEAPVMLQQHTSARAELPRLLDTGEELAAEIDDDRSRIASLDAAIDDRNEQLEEISERSKQSDVTPDDVDVAKKGKYPERTRGGHRGVPREAGWRHDPDRREGDGT